MILGKIWFSKLTLQHVFCFQSASFHSEDGTVCHRKHPRKYKKCWSGALDLRYKLVWLHCEEQSEGYSHLKFEIGPNNLYMNKKIHLVKFVGQKSIYGFLYRKGGWWLQKKMTMTSRTLYAFFKIYFELYFSIIARCRFIWNSFHYLGFDSRFFGTKSQKQNEILQVSLVCHIWVKESLKLAFFSMLTKMR